MRIALIILVSALLALTIASHGAGAATSQHTYIIKIKTAKTKAMSARHSLYWITTHMHRYKNAKQYHAAIVKHRVRLFHWRHQLAKLKAAAAATARPAHYFAWLCIHKYEGSWTDTGAPYYGGLQMDWGFMKTYGGWLLARKGTADKWTPYEQMMVAENALAHGRGFYPWPNTARMCGLI